MVNSPLRQDEIVELLQGYREGQIQFEFVKKDGIKMIFKTNGDVDEAVKTAKKVIKSTDWGSVLYFQVAPI